MVKSGNITATSGTNAAIRDAVAATTQSTGTLAQTAFAALREMSENGGAMIAPGLRRVAILSADEIYQGTYQNGWESAVVFTKQDPSKSVGEISAGPILTPTGNLLTSILQPASPSYSISSLVSALEEKIIELELTDTHLILINQVDQTVRVITPLVGVSVGGCIDLRNHVAGFSVSASAGVPASARPFGE